MQWVVNISSNSYNSAIALRTIMKEVSTAMACDCLCLVHFPTTSCLVVLSVIRVWALWRMISCLVKAVSTKREDVEARN